MFFHGHKSPKMFLIYLLKKIHVYSGPVQLKPVLFKGQLYLLVR